MDTIVDIDPSAQVCILGDFNLPHGLWRNDEYSSAIYPTTAFANEKSAMEIISSMCAFHNLFQLNNIRNSFDSLLDIVLSRTQEIVVTEAEEGIVPSDAYHPPLLIDLPFENFNADMKDISDGYYRCFKSAD